MFALCQLSSAFSCEYNTSPVTATFGAEISGVKVKEIDKECAEKLKQEAYMNRFLLFRDQDLHWMDQIAYTRLLGEPFAETTSINRKKHDKIPDKHLGYFSNDPTGGLTAVGIEGWHVDGNTVEMPHMFTLIYCISASRNGPTLVVPLKEIVDMLSGDERQYLEKVYFVSGHNSSIIHPLLYKDQHRNDDTMMLALGRLSGQYLLEDESGEKKQLSVEETQFIQDLLEAKILSSNKIYAHQYRPGDLLMLYNPTVAHIAGPGSQTPRNVSGLRLMSRTTALGEQKPRKTSNIKYECRRLPPFESGYCLFSLKDSVYYPKLGIFDTQEVARNRCLGINKQADLATLHTLEWNELAREIVKCKEAPHWLKAKNPQGRDVFWDDVKSSITLWDAASEQPNNCDGFHEECVIMGPYGHWFDVPCDAKVKNGKPEGPILSWEDGNRRMFNVYPLCGIELRHLTKHDNIVFT